MHWQLALGGDRDARDALGISATVWSRFGVLCNAEPVDVRITDKDGNVVVDSERDRIERKKTFGELIAAHRGSDSLLTALLKSYGASIHDPDNELVHV